MAYLTTTYNLEKDPHLEQIYNTTLDHYQGLWSTLFAGAFPRAQANSYYASDLYNYASFQYTHNETIRASLPDSELAWLREYAGIQQFSKNADLSGDMIRAISGRTLAARVMAILEQHTTSRGRSNKINVMFGSFEPMLAFFALSKLSDSSGMFQEIPGPGAISGFFNRIFPSLWPCKCSGR